VLLTPALSNSCIRIAILDDDIGTSETLGEWFTAAGYAASAFTSAEQLLSSQVENYDVFVVDFLLASGDSSQATIKFIRQALPDVPIVLLTGKLRDGQVSEADLSALLRTANVTFFEKPVRPSVLAATIEKELDQLAHRRAG
jgi:FixJ family two-component response regulator